MKYTILLIILAIRWAGREEGFELPNLISYILTDMHYPISPPEVGKLLGELERDGLIEEASGRPDLTSKGDEYLSDKLKERALRLHR